MCHTSACTVLTPFIHLTGIAQIWYRIAGKFHWMQNFHGLINNCENKTPENEPGRKCLWKGDGLMASDHCLYKKGRLHHCCNNLALCFVVMLTDLRGSRFARVKGEVWQSFSRGVAWKKSEKFFWRVWKHFRKILHQWNFLHYGTTFVSHYYQSTIIPWIYIPALFLSELCRPRI